MSTTQNNQTPTTIVPQSVKRQFSYGGRVLPDPDASMTPDEVRVFYSAIHADLLNAAVEGGNFEGDTQVFEFKRAVGMKG